MEGKMEAIRYCREKGLPYLGLCVGLHCAVAEFARDVCGLKGADSTEFNPKTKYPVIFLMPGQRGVKAKGGTMRLGAWPMTLKPGTMAAECYEFGKGAPERKGGRARKVSERHRHRYEVNPAYLPVLEKHGLIASGTSPDGKLVEVIELKGHPFFVATQAHPEFKSRPLKPHPLFNAFIRKAHEYSRRRSQTG
jgi:CTP synthase